MDSTEVNSWITLAGIGVTVASVWAAWWVGQRDLLRRRVVDVASRFIELAMTQKQAFITPPLKEFIQAGALSLSQGDMEQAAKMITDAGFLNPLSDLNFREVDVLRRAVSEKVDFEDWVSMTCFLVKESQRSEELKKCPNAYERHVDESEG